MTFVVYAAVLAPLVSATIGSLSLCLGEPSQWNRFTSLWLTWWMGDGFGALIVSPLLLAWSSPRKIESRDMPEITSLFVLLIIVVLIVFGGWFPGPVKTYPLAFLALPCLLWAAMKFHQRVVTSAIVLMAGVAVWGAKQGYGPFVQPSANVSLLLLISFVGTSSLMTLIVAAVTNERREAEAAKSKLGSELEHHRRRIEDIVAHVPGVVWEAWGKPDAANQRIDFVSSHVEKMLGLQRGGMAVALLTSGYQLFILTTRNAPRKKRWRSLLRARVEQAGFVGCTRTAVKFGSRLSR